MMAMRNFNFLYIIFFMASSCISFESKMKLAKSHEDLLQFEDALDYYLAAWEKQKVPLIARRIAGIHLKKRDFVLADNWFYVYSSLQKLSIEDHYDYAKVLIGLSRFEEANYHLEAIERLDRIEAKSPKWSSFRQSAMTAKSILNGPTDYELIPLDDINTQFSEFGYTSFENQKFFISDRFEGEDLIIQDRDQVTGNAFLNIFSGFTDNVTEKFSFKGWNEFKNQLHQGPLHVSESFTFIVQSLNSNRRQRRLGENMMSIVPKIYYKKNQGSDSNFYLLEFNDALNVTYLDPFWDEEKRRLYFVSDQPGGFGKLDIYYSILHSNGVWSRPINLGEHINTFGNERSPFVYQDTLYFSSEGRGGLGGLDIYKVSIANDNFQGVPENLGVPFNSNKDDFFFMIDKWEDDLQVLSSDRDGGKGKDDLYFLRKKEQYRPIVFEFVDEQTREPLNNVVLELVNPLTDVMSTYISDKGGRVITTLPKGIDALGVNLSRSGYVFESFSNYKLGESDTLSFSLKRMMFNKAFSINDILYEFGKDEITAQSMRELEKLAKILLDYPRLRVKLTAHTDARGSEAFNLRLSQRRAKAAHDILVNLGIATSRISYEGKGGNFPIIDCGNDCSDEEYARNRRTEIVLIDDYFYEQDNPALEGNTEQEKIGGGAYIKSSERDNLTIFVDGEVSSFPEIIQVNEGERGKFFHIISSFSSYQRALLASQMYMDQGISIYIIPPYGESDLYRLAVEKFDYYWQASARLDQNRLNFKSPDIWILEFEP